MPLLPPELASIRAQSYSRLKAKKGRKLETGCTPSAAISYGQGREVVRGPEDLPAKGESQDVTVTEAPLQSLEGNRSG